MMVQTERGIILVENTVFAKAQAERAGFSYSFHSSELGLDVYGKTLDDLGHYHSFAILLDKEIGRDAAMRIAKVVPLNDGPYKFYDPLDVSDSSLFVLKPDEIATYNSLVDELNVDCAWLNSYKGGFKDALELAADDFYKERFAHHADLYERYMDIQEDAILRTQKERGVIDNDEYDR